MFEAICFVAGFLFGATAIWAYVHQVNAMIRKMDLLYTDLAIAINEWRKTLCNK